MLKRYAILGLVPVLALSVGVACGRSAGSATSTGAAGSDTGAASEAAASAPAAGSEPSAASSASTPASTVDGALPAHAQSAPAAGALPPGHPPMPSPGGGSVAPPAGGSGTGADALVWTKPQSWVEEATTSGMRKAQYKVTGAGGDAECVVFYFGPGQGGGAEANATRWAQQFDQPDGRPSTEVMKRTPLEADGLKVLMVEVAGTYAGGMGPAMGGDEKKTGQMLLGAIAEGPDANWFFKLLGPEATVRAQAGAFKAMIASLKKGS